MEENLRDTMTTSNPFQADNSLTDKSATVSPFRLLPGSVFVRRHLKIRGFLMALSIFILLFHPGSAHAIDISDFPLELVYRAAAPLVMVVLDDSSSMDFEFMTAENNGTFDNNFYVFPTNPGDNTFSDSIRSPFNLNYMDEYERKAWKSQWQGYNRLYYNPRTHYSPWPDNKSPGLLPDADTSNPRSNPMKISPTFSLGGSYATVMGSSSEITIKNSHYYILDDRNGDGKADYGESVFLINLSGSSRSVYRFNDANSDGHVDDYELGPFDESLVPETIKPLIDGAADLQNFANWYSFYRKRSLTAKAAVARTIAGLSDMRIGFFSINKHLIQDVLPVHVTEKDGSVSDQAPALLTLLYGLGSKGDTPLREGLDAVGRYYRGDKPYGLGPSPYALAEDGGECQRVYALAMTDGYWTETSFSSSDSDHDGYSSTLSDVAYTYFIMDLRPDLADLIFPLACHPEKHQHMVTFSLSFGVAGNLNPENYDDCSLEDADGRAPAWPDPFCKDCKAKVDDLWHASAGTRGTFFNASDPETLVGSLKQIFAGIKDNESTAASVSVSAEAFFSGTDLFQSFYRSDLWTGDVQSFRVTYHSHDKTLEIKDTPQWRAADRLEGRSPSDRNIISFDGTKGVPFDWDELDDSRKALLDLDKDLLHYIRGLEFTKFRSRVSKLGDIVHSSPLPAGNHLYVGANDGMLHAFNRNTGNEAFAYVPGLVFHNLKHLAYKNSHHLFYVDQTPVCSDILVDGEKRIYLVGGLGKGGKGYYCLDITDIDTMGFSESTLASVVRWEFKHDSDLGYSFSEPVIVRTKSVDAPYVVVFGNGYNSAGGSARLFILDVKTGRVIKNLDTLKGDDNGLSSPIAIDVNNDGAADFVYAGDLKGHVWKWDIRDKDPENWDFSFRDKDHQPAALFKTAIGQPVTTRPDVMRHPLHHGYMVCFGTGKYLGLSDLATTNIQAVYGIWDYGDDPGEYLGEFDPLTAGLSNHPDSTGIEVRLLAQTISTTDYIRGVMERTLSENVIHYNTILDSEDPNPNQQKKTGLPNPTKHAGWYLNLEPSERVHQNVRIRNNTLTAMGRTPSLAPCSNGGYSLVYHLNPSSGSMTEKASSIGEPSPLNPPVIITSPSGDHMIFDKDMPAAPAPYNGVKDGIYFWRQYF